MFNILILLMIVGQVLPVFSPFIDIFVILFFISLTWTSFTVQNRLRTDRKFIYPYCTKLYKFCTEFYNKNFYRNKKFEFQINVGLFNIGRSNYRRVYTNMFSSYFIFPSFDVGFGYQFLRTETLSIVFHTMTIFFNVIYLSSMSTLFCLICWLKRLS